MSKLLVQGCLTAWGVTATKAMLFPLMVVLMKQLLQAAGGPAFGGH